MLDYLATFTNTNGLGFPLTAAINASGGAATDGTEFTANMINDSMWGVFQALMDYTGQTPNGIVESISNSQILEAFRRFETPGKIISVVFNDDPAVLGIRAIMLTGQGILRANFPELDNNVYVGDGNNAAVAAAGGAFYRADDAAGTIPNIAGIYLILPDARGRVIRGLDLTGSVDPDGAGRFLGDSQIDAGQRILGSFFARRGNAGQDLSLGQFGVFSDGGDSGNNVTWLSDVATEPNQILQFDNADSLSPNASKTDDNETRMTNLSANLMITY